MDLLAAVSPALPSKIVDLLCNPMLKSKPHLLACFQTLLQKDASALEGSVRLVLPVVVDCLQDK